MSLKERFSHYVEELQDRITGSLEKLDGSGTFEEDLWTRDGGGGGRTRVLEGGALIEKGGVNVSAVHGELPETIQSHFGVDQGWFYATGLSLVLHPRNPMVPIVHANFRFFELYGDEGMTDVVDRWYGGGADLTPAYLFEEDAVHFHRVWKEVCDRHGETLYPEFKKQCDDYFYNHHRDEARGVGGLFFDYLRKTDERTSDDWHRFVVDAGDRFLDSWVPIAERRRDESFGEAERTWQELRRGRYVEFNLIHDRGTLFGLKTGGRIESILMSLPPRVQWGYRAEPKPGSREEALVEVLRNPREWI